MEYKSCSRLEVVLKAASDRLLLTLQHEIVYPRRRGIHSANRKTYNIGTARSPARVRLRLGVAAESIYTA